jgi:hypothetical protein
VEKTNDMKKRVIACIFKMNEDVAKTAFQYLREKEGINVMYDDSQTNPTIPLWVTISTTAIPTI